MHSSNSGNNIFKLSWTVFCNELNISGSSLTKGILHGTSLALLAEGSAGEPDGCIPHVLTRGYAGRALDWCWGLKGFNIRHSLNACVFANALHHLTWFLPKLIHFVASAPATQRETEPSGGNQVSPRKKILLMWTKPFMSAYLLTGAGVSNFYQQLKISRAFHMGRGESPCTTPAVSTTTKNLIPKV